MTNPLADLLVQNILGTGRASSLEGEMPSARALRSQAKRRFLNMDRERHLRETLTAPPAAGESVHIISDGKFDFWTWVPVMLDWIGKTDALYCSTWTLSRPNALDLFAVHDAGQIAKGQIHILTGLYFKRRETAVYNLLLSGIHERGGRYKAFENHAKVLLLSNRERDTWITVEGSANLNANPRLEQYVITHDRALHDFHRTWMEEAFTARDKRDKARRKTDTLQPRTTLGFSCRRAGLGVLAARNDPTSRRRVIREKTATVPDWTQVIRDMTDDLVPLIRQFAPVIPATWLVTVPPQGASWPRDYLAARLGESVAARLGLRFLPLITRTDTKTHHHPMAALQQTPFVSAPAPGDTVLVIDDLLTSGRTMKLALEAVRATGTPAFGFAFNGS